MVNGELKMGKGKIGSDWSQVSARVCTSPQQSCLILSLMLLAAAQCAHAAVGLYQENHSTNLDLFELWEENSGQKKIALSCQSENELVSQKPDFQLPWESHKNARY